MSKIPVSLRNIFGRKPFARRVKASRLRLKHALLGVQKELQKNTRKYPAFKPLWNILGKMWRGLSRVLIIITWPLRQKWILIMLLVMFIGLSIGLAFLVRDLPSPRTLESGDHFSVSTQIFDRHGTLLFEIYGDENRIPITLGELPPHVTQATIAIEDQNFYSHFGVDPRGIGRAIVTNVQGSRLEGGSTITQQLVKNALLTNERSYQRKIKEAVLAVLTEILYSKDEIMEMYLNYISYGGTAVGVESAAQRYFNKSARDLTIAEAALLAGLPQAPSRYSPFGSSPEQAKQRQTEVLRRMEEEGFISKLEREQAVSEPLNYALSKNDIKAPHFVFFVRDLLYEQYGVKTVERGGLRVTTTLDLSLQESAQASLSAQIAELEGYNVGNGAAMVVKPNTGEILAMIGSKDYFNTEEDGQVNVTLASRQPGSSIKPIMYATAFQNRVLNPGTMLVDAPTCFPIINQKPYCPKNYDGSFRGPVSVRSSLAMSLNIPAVKGLKIIGLEEFISQARAMGISSWQDPSRYGLSLTLGGGEVKMIEMAQAFSVLANEGVKTPLTPILKISDYKGNLIAQTNIDERKDDLRFLFEYGDDQKGDLQRVMDRAPAYLASHIMQDNKARTPVFGARSKLVIPNQIVSAKTGTTNDLKDNWTVGFTPEFLTIVWVGNNDGSPMNQRLVSGITGAAPIFNDIMSYVLRDQEPVWQEKPPDVLSAQVCETGFPKVEGQDCTPKETELYWEYGQPSNSRFEKQNVWIDPTTGLPPPFGQVVEGLVLEERTILRDPVTQDYCLDCSRPTKEDGTPKYEQYIVRDEYIQQVRDEQSAGQ